MQFKSSVPNKPHGSSRLARAIGLIVLSVLVLWQLVTKELAYYLALEAPETALRLRPTEATALVSLADQWLNIKQANLGNTEFAAAPTNGAETVEQIHDRLGGWAEMALKAAANKLPLETTKTSLAKEALNKKRSEASSLGDRDREQVRAMAESVLYEAPLNARALRILGQLADSAGDEAKAQMFMQAAAHRSLSESAAVYWLMQRSVENKQYATTVTYADIFLRKRPQLIALAIPFLVKVAESQDPDVRAVLNSALLGNPPWRGQFFAALPTSISDARTPLEFLLSAKDTPTPPTTEDINAYLRFLIANKFYELAYYTWLQFLPPEKLSTIKYLSNGSFETAPSGLPFDWVISTGSGVTIDLATRPDADDQHALFLEFGPGRVDFHGVSQLLLLAPGTYRMKGQYKGELTGSRGLQWKIRCAGNTQAPIGEGPMFLGSAPIWTDFEFAFTVPASDCQAQELRLEHTARSASEQLLSGRIWFDEFDLVRADKAVGLP